MSIPLGARLKIRAMIHMAAEPIPFFWPMRTFIHHNPLHGLEHLPFPQALAVGAKLFHGQAYLPRETYQGYLAADKIDRTSLQQDIAAFNAKHNRSIPGIDLNQCLMTLITQVKQPVSASPYLANAADIHATLHDSALSSIEEINTDSLAGRLREQLLNGRPVYEVVDLLYGAQIGEELDELVIKSCLDFFDEGQSVWEMPEREAGFFNAWRNVAKRNLRFFLRGLRIHRVLAEADKPEDIIAHVLHELGVPEARWMDYFTYELSRLHGWAGFIRWRTSAKHYYWNERYPGDLIDFVAIRLTLALALLDEHGHGRIQHSLSNIEQAIDQYTKATYLRHEWHSGDILPAMAHTIEQAIASGKPKPIEQAFIQYVELKRVHEAREQATRLQKLFQSMDAKAAAKALTADQVGQLLQILADFEQQEGMIWLRSLEAKATHDLLNGINLLPPTPREKRPFTQALFCIDTRSERIRRHLEGAGDYQTFGIAGFFGVPVSFMELGKGSETHLCPVILTPKNLVPEISAAGPQDNAALTALEKAMHELKESVLTPFVTVEAIGLLFGFDMVGKTVAPQIYNRLRKHLHPDKPPTRLLIDKLSREQADSIVRAVQRAVIGKAVEQEFGLAPEDITDRMIRELREAALEHLHAPLNCAETLELDDQAQKSFIERLQTAYRINRSFAEQQMERLGRIGYTLDEQVNYVGQALRAIGLVEDFSRFVLLVGHGSTSENNPYESALDCGACGGNHGLVSGRVLAEMANKPQVRRRLQEQGIDIPDDTWFIPAMHDTTTDEIRLHDLDLLPPSHLVYLDRLRNGLTAATRLCAQERAPSLDIQPNPRKPAMASRFAQRNSMDWSQVRPEWGLSRNLYFIIGRRNLTQKLALDGRAFLHSYDYQVDPKQRLLDTILTGPLVVGQWINMEHYFSAVDNDRFGSGSKVNHNVAGRFGVMTGNLSDLRTGLPAQTVLKDGEPYHEPMRLITLIEAPFQHALEAIEGVATVKNLVQNAWIRLVIVDPETYQASLYEDGEWQTGALAAVNEGHM